MASVIDDNVDEFLSSRRLSTADCGGGFVRNSNSYPLSSSSSTVPMLEGNDRMMNKATRHTRTKSASIPINQESMRKIASEHQIAAVVNREADYQDYLFFSRVYDGIKLQNSSLEDGSYLKSMNESLLDNIARSRCCDYHDCDCDNNNNNNSIVEEEEEESLLSIEEQQCSHDYHDHDSHYSNLSNDNNKALPQPPLQLQKEDYSKIIPTPATTMMNLSLDYSKIVPPMTTMNLSSLYMITGTAFDLDLSTDSVSNHPEEDEQQRQEEIEYDHIINHDYQEDNDNHYDGYDSIEGMFGLDL